MRMQWWMQLGKRGLACLLLAGAGLGCSSSSGERKTEAEFRAEVIAGMREIVAAELLDLNAASQRLVAAAPPPRDNGWSMPLDTQAIADMRTAWLDARRAYERVEGAVAPLFPESDSAIDARYDDFLSQLGPLGDTNLFDGEGVSGMHAVERILYSNVLPARVIAFESTLPGYRVAAFPASLQQASDFREGLCGRLVVDTRTLYDGWRGATHFDLAAAFEGLIGLMNEQREKVDKAATSEEESRYAQNSMRDIRDNLQGTRAVYILFKPWMIAQESGVTGTPSGRELDTQIEAGFQRLDSLYSSVVGDAVPQPPSSWSGESPSAIDAASDFGRLYLGVSEAVDANRPDSVVSAMTNAMVLLGLSQ